MDSKEQKTEQSPVVTTVTRVKHPGRVAQGKKLAAMMKERKEALLKNKDKNEDSELYNSTVSSTSQVLASAAGSALNNFGVYGGVILLIASGIYYLYSRRKAFTQAPLEPPKKQSKIYME